MTVTVDAGTMLRAVGTRSIFAVPFLGLLYLSRSGDDDATGWASPAAPIGVGICVVVVLLLLTTTRVRVDDHQIVFCRLCGWARRVPRSDIGGGVLAETFRQTGERAAPILLLAGTDGRLVKQLSGLLFSPDNLHRLVDELGAERFRMLRAPVRLSHLGESFPDLIPWWQRHQLMLGILLGIAIVLAVITWAASTS